MKAIFAITEPAQGCGVYASLHCSSLISPKPASLLDAYLYPWIETTARNAVSYIQVIIPVDWELARDRDFIDEFSNSFLILYKIQGCGKPNIGNTFDSSELPGCNIGGESYFTVSYNYYSRVLILILRRFPTRVDKGVSSVIDGRTPLNMAENEGLHRLSGAFTTDYNLNLCFLRSLGTLFVWPDFRPWDALSVTYDTPGYLKCGAKSRPGTESGQSVAITGDEHFNGCRYCSGGSQP